MYLGTSHVNARYPIVQQLAPLSLVLKEIICFTRSTPYSVPLINLTAQVIIIAIFGASYSLESKHPEVRPSNR